jgi:peptidoglycan glycosyltransferase
MEDSARAADPWTTVKRLTLLAAAVLAAFAFAASASAAGNPFGVTVVRFTPKTTPAQMRAAVTAAGGVVVADLSPIHAFAVVSRSSGFDARLASSRSVTALFQDTLIGAERSPDGTRAGGGRSAPGAGSGDVDFDPWHALFQWDDDRMDVAPAWQRTTGDRSIAVAVIVENGGGYGEAASGGAVAAPIARAVLQAVIGS